MGGVVLDGGLLRSDIAAIMSGTESPIAIQYDAVLYSPNRAIETVQFNQLEIMRDYVNNISDHTILTMTMGMGDFIYDVVPHADDLTVAIKTKYYDKTVTIKHKFVMTNNLSNINGSMRTSLSREAMNETELVVVEGQCIHMYVEAIRNTYINDIFNGCTVKDVIVGNFIKVSRGVSIGGVPVKLNCNIVPPNNTRKYAHINVPLGTKLLDLPSYLQNTDYGVYTTGIGTYFQPFCLTEESYADTLFVYPLHNTKQFNNDVRKLSIISVPTTKLSGIENTYLLQGKTLKILGHGDMLSYDNADTDLINDGSGFIVSSPGSVINGHTHDTRSTVTNKKADNVAGYKVKTKRDGVDGTNYVGVTDNLYKEYSAVAVRSLSLYQIQWKFCNHELLYPGMPVGYTYEHAEFGVVTLTGVLQSVYVKFDNTNKTTSCLINALLDSSIDNYKKKDEVIDLRS